MKAVILVAGRGTRLKPLTDKQPKCLTEINGKSILENTLEILARYKINETIIVTGYLANKVKIFGNNYNGMKLTYVENKRYKETNNIYSVWKICEYVKDDDVLLIEGDMFFEERVIKKLLESPYKNCAVLDHYIPLLEGSVVELTDDGLLKDIFFNSDQIKEFDYSNKYKTVNIYKLSTSLVYKFLVYISKRIVDGKVNDYYEETFQDIIRKEGYDGLFMKGIVIKGFKWFEIDNLQDIDIAERVFLRN